MHRQLAAFDPATAARLSPNDSQRIQRAIEIHRATGQTMSQLLAAERPTDDSPYEYKTISLEPSDRAVLHARIAQRYRQMLGMGLVDEVRALHARPDLHAGLPSVRCVGYRQIWSYLSGECSLEQAVEQAIAATRQLAKRQLTWLRAQPDRTIVDCLAPDAAGQVAEHAARIWAR